jgi:hypothetical protein
LCIVYMTLDSLISPTHGVPERKVALTTPLKEPSLFLLIVHHHRLHHHLNPMMKNCCRLFFKF